MNKNKLSLICLSLTVFFLSPGIAFSQETAVLQVENGAICLDVVNRECIEGKNSFPADVGRLFCLTKIDGSIGTSQISHVWYYGDIERAQVMLDIRSVSWRTYSSKIIQPHEIGPWNVKILGPTGDILDVIEFEITP